MKRFLKWLFKRSERFIVWNAYGEQIQCWHEDGELKNRKKGRFHFIIYYYPYRYNNRYVLEYEPKTLDLSNDSYNKAIISITNHPMYTEALTTLREFQESELVASIELPKVKGVDI
jgi:hypothetical protein